MKNLFLPCTIALFILLCFSSCTINNITSNDNTAPNISILFPIENSIYYEGESIVIRIDASDKNNISTVELLINGNLEKSFIDTPYTHIWNTVGNSGNHTIKAKATDENDNVGNSDVITIEVLQNTAPRAGFSYSRVPGTTEDIIGFSAITCEDSEQGLTELMVRWDWENDNIWDTEYSYSKETEHEYNEKEIYTVKMEVIDPGNLIDSISRTFDLRGLPYVYISSNVKDHTDYFSFVNNTGSANEGAVHDIIFYTVILQNVYTIPQFKVKEGLSIAILRNTNLDNVIEVPTNNDFITNYSTENDEWFYLTNDSYIVLPYDNVYVVNTTDGKYPAFEIMSYYDNSGNSGVYTINWKYLAN